jgi:sodium/bile acid cotransporter 7
MCCFSKSERIKMAEWDETRRIMVQYLILASSLLLLFPAGVLCAGSPEDQANKKTVYRIYSQLKKESPSVPEISVNDAIRLFKKGKVVFVDLRTSEEMEVSALPGAISKEEYLRDPSRFDGMTMIAYCTISYRSGIFVKEMTEKGTSFYNLAGGILAWVHEGGKIFDAHGETKRIHVYGEKWNYPPAGYEAVKFGFIEKFFR